MDVNLEKEDGQEHRAPVHTSKKIKTETFLYKLLTSYRVPIPRRRIRSKTSLAAEGSEARADS